MERGCGKRKKGATYIEVELGPTGIPVSWFWCEPPQLIDVNELGLSPIGVKILPRAGVEGLYDVYDIVGGEYYPNVADFVEETHRMGISRRVSTTADFEKLTEGSRLFLFHAKAHIDGANVVLQDAGREVVCPKLSLYTQTKRPHPDGMCIGAWWHDLVDGGTRAVGQTTYEGQSWPENAPKPHHRMALFGVFPISGLAVIRDPEGGKHIDAIERASASSLPVKLSDE